MVYDPFKEDRVAKEAVEEMFGDRFQEYYHYYIFSDCHGPCLRGMLWNSKFAPSNFLTRLKAAQCNELLGARKFLPRRARK
jgi:hypothetical protein